MKRALFTFWIHKIGIYSTLTIIHQNLRQQLCQKKTKKTLDHKQLNLSILTGNRAYLQTGFKLSLLPGRRLDRAVGSTVWMFFRRKMLREHPKSVSRHLVVVAQHMGCFSALTITGTHARTGFFPHNAHFSFFFFLPHGWLIISAHIFHIFWLFYSSSLLCWHRLNVFSFFSSFLDNQSSPRKKGKSHKKTIHRAHTCRPSE